MLQVWKDILDAGRRGKEVDHQLLNRGLVKIAMILSHRRMKEKLCTAEFLKMAYCVLEVAAQSGFQKTQMYRLGFESLPVSGEVVGAGYITINDLWEYLYYAIKCLPLSEKRSAFNHISEADEMIQEVIAKESQGSTISVVRGPLIENRGSGTYEFFVPKCSQSKASLVFSVLDPGERSPEKETHRDSNQDSIHEINC